MTEQNNRMLNVNNAVELSPGQPIIIDMETTELEYYVQHLYVELNRMLKGKPMNAGNLAITCLSMMALIEKFPKLAGPQKKEVLIKVFRKYIWDFGQEPDNVKEYYLSCLDGMMDTMISIDKGEITIKIKPKKCLKFFGCSGK